MTPLVSPPPKPLRADSSSLDVESNELNVHDKARVNPESSSGLSTPTYGSSNTTASAVKATTTPTLSTSTPSSKLGSITKQINNNYSAPHTPIASAKRPRQPASGTKSNFGNVGGISSPTAIASNTNGQSGNKLDDIQEHSDDFEYGQGVKHNHDNVSGLLSPVGKMKPLEEDDVDKQEQLEEVEEEHVAYQRSIVSNTRFLSPMHPAKPLTKYDLVHESSNTNTAKHGMDASSSSSEPVKSKFKTLNKIFSPVLNFLSSSSSTNSTITSNSILSKKEQVEETVVVEDEYYYMKSITDSDGDVCMQEEQDSPLMPRQHLSYEEQVEVTSSTTSYVEYEYLQEAEKIQPNEEEEGENEDEDDDDSDEGDEFNPYYFIKHLPAYHQVVTDPTKKIHLPPKDPSDPPISLVLDLDETLVHCTIEHIPDPDMTFPVFFNGVQYTVYVRTRPYLMEFLEAVADKFEVVVFTASQKVYANELLDRIDPDGRYIKHRMFRESCLFVEGNYLKDLNVLGRDLSAAVLVDNSPHAFGYQVDNGIPIESWFDDPNDAELLKLEKFLSTLEGVDDVRVMIRSKFQTYKLIRDA